MFDSMGSILEALSPEQQIACSTQNNILLTACPGSGKTRTLTHGWLGTVERSFFHIRKGLHEKCIS